MNDLELNPIVESALLALAANPDRTMTRGQFRQWHRDRRQEPLPEPALTAEYQEKLALREQIELEIKPIKDRRVTIWNFSSKARQLRPAAEPVPYVSSVVIPPPIKEDLTLLSDKEGPAEREALSKLDAIPERLKDRLMEQLRPRLARIQALTD